MATETRIRGIQGLRGIAVGLVLLNHFKLLFPHGYVGVDVFFVISGFVITRQLVSAHNLGQFSPGQFYLRRFRRLFAPLAVVILIALLMTIAVGNFRAVELAFSTGMAAIFGVANVSIQISNSEYFAPDALVNPLLHTWSLSVEEQFYIIYPWILIAILKSRLRRRLLLLVVVASSLLSFSLFLFQNAFANLPYLSAVLGFYSPVIRAWEFGLGGLVYWLHNRFSHRDSRLNLVLIWASLTGLLAVSNFPFETNQWFIDDRTWVTVFAACLTGVLLYASKEGNNSSNPLETTPLRWLGDRSYSIYLTHYLIVYLVAEATIGRMEEPLILIAGLASSVATGALLFRLVERGAFAAWFKSSKIANLAFAGITPAVLAACYLVAGFVNPHAAQAEKARNVEAPTCHRSDCWTKNGLVGDSLDSEGTKVFLIGDSNARMFYWPVLSAAQELEYDLFSRTYGGCPMLSAYGQSECKGYIETVLEVLEHQPPSIVALGTSDLYVVSDPGSDFYLKPLAFVGELLEVTKTIESMGHSVIVIEPIPNLSATTAGNPELVSHWLGATKISLEPRIELQSWLPDSITFRTESLLCPEGVCEILSEGQYVFRDGTHITKFGSLKFVQQFRERLNEFSLH